MGVKVIIVNIRYGLLVASLLLLQGWLMAASNTGQSIRVQRNIRAPMITALPPLAPMHPRGKKPVFKKRNHLIGFASAGALCVGLAVQDKTKSLLAMAAGTFGLLYYAYKAVNHMFYARKDFSKESLAQHWIRKGFGKYFAKPCPWGSPLEQFESIVYAQKNAATRRVSSQNDCGLTECSDEIYTLQSEYTEPPLIVDPSCSSLTWKKLYDNGKNHKDAIKTLSLLTDEYYQWRISHEGMTASAKERQAQEQKLWGNVVNIVGKHKIFAQRKLPVTSPSDGIPLSLEVIKVRGRHCCGNILHVNVVENNNMPHCAGTVGTIKISSKLQVPSIDNIIASPSFASGADASAMQYFIPRFLKRPFQTKLARTIPSLVVALAHEIAHVAFYHNVVKEWCPYQDKYEEHMRLQYQELYADVAALGVLQNESYFRAQLEWLIIESLASGDLIENCMCHNEKTGTLYTYDELRERSGKESQWQKRAHPSLTTRMDIALTAWAAYAIHVEKMSFENAIESVAKKCNAIFGDDITTDSNAKLSLECFISGWERQQYQLHLKHIKGK